MVVVVYGAAKDADGFGEAEHVGGGGSVVFEAGSER